MLSEKKTDTEWHTLYDSMYVYEILKKGTQLGVEGKWLQENMRELPGINKNVLYLDCGGGYIDVYICQNALKHTLQMGAFYYMYVYLYSKEFNLTQKEEVWPLTSTLGK